MDQVIKKLGYKPSVFDPCLYYGKDMIVLAYVDDILMFGKDDMVLKNALDGFKGRVWILLRMRMCLLSLV